eukprot:scaffold304992_cov30-Tisochrysis_lutea.AAC.4
MVAELRVRISRARRTESLGRVAMSNMNLAADDCDGMAPPALLNEPTAHFVRDVGGELLIVGARKVVEEGKLAGAEEHLGDAQLIISLIQAKCKQQDLAEGGRVECSN